MKPNGGYIMANKEREYKQLPFYVQKIDSDLGVVDAIVAVMGNIDHQGDIIDPGAFTKTIKERGSKIRILDNHNTGSTRDVVGIPLFFNELSRNGLPQELLQEYPEATGGLFASIQFLMDTTEGGGVFKRIKAKAISEYSIGYDALDTMRDIVKDKSGNETNVRRLKTIRLWEISPVIFAANDATLTVGAKATNDNEAGVGKTQVENEKEPKAKKPDKEESDKDEKEPTDKKPYGIFTNEGEHCVFKIDEEGNQLGDSFGCHATREEAADQVRALFAAENDKDSHEDDDKPKKPKKPKENDNENEDKDVSGKTTFPLAGRDVAWDSNKAESRVREFTKSENEPSASYKDGFFWFDSDNSDTFGAYKLGFTDIIDGKRMAIPRGIFAVTALLQDTPDIPESDINSIKTKVSSYYKKMSSAFNEEIEPPWEKSDNDISEQKALEIAKRLLDVVQMHKEMTEHGPQQRFGDLLQGHIHKVFTSIADKYYIEGYINREQRILLSNAIGKALDVLTVSIPEDIANMQVHYYHDEGCSHVAYMNNDIEQDVKTNDVLTKKNIIYLSSALKTIAEVLEDADIEQDTKAGRVLARRNATRLSNALMTIIEILEDAGIDLPNFDSTPDETDEKNGTLENQAVSEDIAPEKAAQQQDNDETGPKESPISDRDKLLQLININISELELLED